MRELRESQVANPYNNEPVYYCKKCLSLAVQVIGNWEEEDSVCSICNRTDVGQTDIFTWREMWKEKYGEYPEEKMISKRRNN